MKARIEKEGICDTSQLGRIGVFRIITQDGQGIAIRTESFDASREGNARSGSLNISREGALSLIALLAASLTKGELKAKDSILYPKPKKKQ